MSSSASSQPPVESKYRAMVEPLRFWSTHPGQAKKRGVKRKLTTIILSRITNWRSKGPACDTDEDENKPMPVRRKGPMRHDSSNCLASAVTSKLEDGSYTDAIRLICCADESASDTPKTLAGLQAKLPPAPLDRKPVYDPKLSDRFTPLQISERSIVDPFLRFQQARRLVLTVSLQNTSKT